MLLGPLRREVLQQLVEIEGTLSETDNRGQVLLQGSFEGRPALGVQIERFVMILNSGVLQFRQLLVDEGDEFRALKIKSERVHQREIKKVPTSGACASCADLLCTSLH